MNWDDLEDAPFTKGGPGWVGRLEGFCPVQGEGAVDDVFWYFRARWDDWSFDVFTKEPKWDGTSYDHFVWGIAGGYGNASWMKYSDAWKIIEEQIAAWRSRADKERET